MVVPSVTMNELSEEIQTTKNETVKKVLIGILNDFMDLQYGKTTPYTSGQAVLPNETTIQDVDIAAAQTNDRKFKDIFVKISETYKSGDLTPQSKNGDNGLFWDPKCTPVLVLVRSNP
uniref:Uncharacterized protein n=1 Tax=Pectinophora gossypiella TaxID=13191 RepID=A0A1E1W9J5_PECGO